MNVSLALYHAVKRYRGNDKVGRGIAAVAKVLGLSDDVLGKKLNPACDSHHITLDEAEEIALIIGDPAPSIEFARVMGMVCIPSPKPAESGMLYRSISDVAREFSDLMNAIQEAVRDNEISPNEMARMQHEAGELMVEVQGLLARAHAMSLNRAHVIPIRETGT